jgi:CubicO group peptidase (beta-lactamase class C family)
MPRFAILMSLFVSGLVAPLIQGEDLPQRVERLDQYLSSEAKRFHLPGVAIAVVEGDEIVHVSTFGEGVAEDSAFIIGSCSKTVTALAALLAFDEAGIDLETPITTLLDGVTVHGEDRPPTLRQLLQHRSGLTRAQGFDVVPSLSEIEAHGLSLDLKFPPGKRFNYSNKNYALLGVLIEKVTAQTYCQYIQEHVFERAGMMASSCGPFPSTSNAVPEYQYCFGFPLRVGMTEVPETQIPSGFLRCTAHDLARLQICLLHDGAIDGDQIFPARLVRQMKTPSGEREFGYGMGLSNRNLDGLGLIHAHEGATPTSYAYHGALAEKELGIVLLININFFDPFTDHGETIYENMLRILDGQEPIATDPYRIWVRWALIPVVLFTVWQVGRLLIRWRKAAWPFAWPTTPRLWLSLVFQLVLPIGIWIAVLNWVQTPFVATWEHDPDIIGAFLFMTAAGMVTGVVKTCAGDVLSPSH